MTKCPHFLALFKKHHSIKYLKDKNTYRKIKDCL